MYIHFIHTHTNKRTNKQASKHTNQQANIHTFMQKLCILQYETTRIPRPSTLHPNSPKHNTLYPFPYTPSSKPTHLSSLNNRQNMACGYP